MDDEIFKKLAARITAKERHYRESTDWSWGRHDYTAAIRLRGIADGLELARDLLVRLIADPTETWEDELPHGAAAGVSTPLDGKETARSAPEQQSPPRTTILLPDE